MMAWALVFVIVGLWVFLLASYLGNSD